jgi:hypothetical protein
LDDSDATRTATAKFSQKLAVANVCPQPTLSSRLVLADGDLNLNASLQRDALPWQKKKEFEHTFYVLVDQNSAERGKNAKRSGSH